MTIVFHDIRALLDNDDQLSLFLLETCRDVGPQLDNPKPVICGCRSPNESPIFSGLIILQVWFQSSVSAIPKAVKLTCLSAMLCLLWASGLYAEDRRHQLKLIAGKPIDGIQTIKIHQGDRLRIKISADKKSILHLHGYNIKITVAAGKSVELSFVAKIAGRFPLNIHRHHQKKKKGLNLGRDHGAIAYVEVHPN